MDASRIRGPLRKNAANPRYFTDDSGRAVYLTGSHTWNNLMDMGKGDLPPVFDFDMYLDFLAGHNHNFIRLWAWDRICTWDPADRVSPFPWARTGPGRAVDGKPKFDLTEFDGAHSERLRTRVAKARQRGIYVSIMLFEGWAIFTSNKTRLDWHVFAKDNNVNGFDIVASEADGILRDWVTLDNPAVVEAQEAYVRHVVDTVNEYDNVLYEICNEAGKYSHDWQEHLIGFVHRYEATKPKQHPVGTTGGMGTLNERLYGSSADWLAPEGWVPPGQVGGYLEGLCTWGAAPFDRADKVVLLDTDHLWGIGGDEVWAWKSFCRGYNVLYMDRCDDLPWAFFEHEWFPAKHNPRLRREMGGIRAYADRMDLNRALPRSELASTSYCLAQPGVEYLAYQPQSGPFTVRLEAGSYRYEWHDPSTGERGEQGRLRSGGGDREFVPPFDGDAVLYLAASDRRFVRPP
jgi:hypothetical protein